MSTVAVQKIREADQSRPLLQETIQLLDRVRTRAFELFENRGRTPGSEIGDWLQAEKEVFRVPDMELSEGEWAFQLEIALPGFDAGDIRVAALPDALIVEGQAAHQHRNTHGTIHLCEFGERRVFRRIPLPKPIDVDHVSANLENGLLRVRAAKTEVKGKRPAA